MFRGYVFLDLGLQFSEVIYSNLKFINFRLDLIQISAQITHGLLFFCFKLG